MVDLGLDAGVTLCLVDIAIADNAVANIRDRAGNPSFDER